MTTHRTISGRKQRHPWLALLSAESAWFSGSDVRDVLLEELQRLGDQSRCGQSCGSLEAAARPVRFQTDLHIEVNTGLCGRSHFAWCSYWGNHATMKECIGLGLNISGRTKICCYFLVQRFDSRQSRHRQHVRNKPRPRTWAQQL